MGLSDFLLKLLSKFHLVEINVNLDTLNIGGQSYKVENQKIIVDIGGTETRIPLIRGKDGFYRPQIEGTVVEGLSEEKKANVENLDNEGKIFTRSDIGTPQLELLSALSSHEALLRKLKPIVGTHNGGRDMGALVAASAIIRVEDKGEDIDLSVRLHENFGFAFKARGAMIYNLFRSGILENEIIGSLDKFAKVYKPGELPVQFLVYWDSIIERGYPTAYFIRHNDSEETFIAQMDWRFDSGAKIVRIFSRTASRNQEARKWCREYAASRGYKYSEGKTYKLGFSPAVKITISGARRSSGGKS